MTSDEGRGESPKTVSANEGGVCESKVLRCERTKRTEDRGTGWECAPRKSPKTGTRAQKRKKVSVLPPDRRSNLGVRLKQTRSVTKTKVKLTVIRPVRERFKRCQG